MQGKESGAQRCLGGQHHHFEEIKGSVRVKKSFKMGRIWKFRDWRFPHISLHTFGGGITVDMGPQRCPLPLNGLSLLGTIRPGCGQLCSSRGQPCQDRGWDAWNTQVPIPVESVTTEQHPGCQSLVLKDAVWKIELLRVSRGRGGRESRYKRSKDSKREVTVFECCTRGGGDQRKKNS